MSSLWEQRAARNEALFREVSENIARLEDRFGGSAPQPVFICECSSDSCTEHIAVDAETYQWVREHPRRFLVLPGHVDKTVESVIVTCPRLSDRREDGHRRRRRRTVFVDLGEL